MKIRSSRKTELREKGWSDQDLRHAETVLERGEKKDIFFSRIVFWSALFVIIVGNLITSLLLIPFLVVFNPLMLYILTILLGVTIGFLYNFLITDVEHLEWRHHLLAGVIIPLIAIINMVLVVTISNKLISQSNIKTATHDPFITALIFVIAFLLPYVIDRIRMYIQDARQVTITR